MDALETWAENQRALARALGLSLEEWLLALRGASERTPALTAAVIGAAVARGLGARVVAGLDGKALAERAAQVIDPRPPQVDNPVLREAIRRAEVAPGTGAARLAQKREVTAPLRGITPLGESADAATADAPGKDSP